MYRCGPNRRPAEIAAGRWSQLSSLAEPRPDAREDYSSLSSSALPSISCPMRSGEGR